MTDDDKQTIRVHFGIQQYDPAPSPEMRRIMDELSKTASAAYAQQRRRAWRDAFLIIVALAVGAGVLSALIRLWTN